MTRSLLFTLGIAAVLIVAVTAQTGSDAAAGQSTNFWTIKVVEDSQAKEPVVDLHNPRTVTICADTSPELIRVSVDGKHWHDLAGSGVGKCIQAPPVRFVKLEKLQAVHDSDGRDVGPEAASAEVYATY